MAQDRTNLRVATVLASAAALFITIETPGLSPFFGGTPIGPVMDHGDRVRIVGILTAEATRITTR